MQHVGPTCWDSAFALSSWCLWSWICFQMMLRCYRNRCRQKVWTGIGHPSIALSSARPASCPAKSPRTTLRQSATCPKPKPGPKPFSWYLRLRLQHGREDARLSLLLPGWAVCEKSFSNNKQKICNCLCVCVYLCLQTVPGQPPCLRVQHGGTGDQCSLTGFESSKEEMLGGSWILHSLSVCLRNSHGPSHMAGKGNLEPSCKCC